MGFWHEVNHGPGYDTDALSESELAVVRGFIQEQYLSGLGEAAPELVAAAAAAGLDQYHTLPIPFDHGSFWSKARRVLPASTAAAFATMGFFQRIRACLPSAEIYAEDLMWRIVRPGQPSDVGPVHADKWFWEAGNGSISADRERLKVWIALYAEPGLNGLCVKPHSHESDRWKRHFEFKHGIMKPVLDEDEANLDMLLLPLTSGEMVFFHDGLLHGGFVNRGTACRVSLELTATYRADEGARLSAGRAAA